MLDTMFFIFRSFYAVPHIEAPCGSPINAVYGVLALLKNLWQTEQYRHLVAVFESPGPSFRKELDEEYKANRPPAPVGLKSQVAMVRVACECLGIKTIHVDGYEADDVIGTLAKRATESECAATIVSNDKDLAQVLALSPYIELLRTGRGGRPERVAADEVEKIYGVPPNLIASWLALMGDSSDNIKGVRGIGKKTATKMLKEHGDVHALLADPEKAGRFAPAFRDGRERILKDLDLATIRTNADLGPDGFPSDCYELRTLDGAQEFFKSLGMRAYVNKLEEIEKPDPTIIDLWDHGPGRSFY